MALPPLVLIAFSTAEADRKAAASLAEGFARDGAEVVNESHAAAVLARVEQRTPDLLVVAVQLDGAAEQGLELVHTLRERLGVARPAEMSRPPVIVVGEAEKRTAALEAGATAFIPRPAFVKDLVTLGRVFSMPRDGFEPGWGGELGALHLYYIVRALSASSRTGVVTLLRGGRRGELRFFEGEVTSAQVGSLHGQAAFHQLLLWPEARFDLRVESVVRRQQIPLSPAELLQDAERFLRDFDEMAGGISPASVYEQDLRGSAERVAEIPREVTPILRLFDGTRSVADVIEDSPMRMPETLKVVRNLILLAAVRKRSAPRPQADAAAALQVEDWLVGQSAPVVAPAPRAADLASSPTPTPGGVQDWGNLSGTTSSPSYAPVVPAQATTGEIQTASPDEIAGATPAGESPRAPSSEARTSNGQGGRRSVSISGEISVPETGEASPSPLPAPAATSHGKFEDHEEAFFSQEEQFGAHHPAPPAESFGDLDDDDGDDGDDGHPPATDGFWRRLLRRWLPSGAPPANTPRPVKKLR